MTSDCDGDTILMGCAPARARLPHGRRDVLRGLAPVRHPAERAGRAGRVCSRRGREASRDGFYVAGMLAGEREGPQRKVGEEAVEVLLAEPGFLSTS